MIWTQKAHLLTIRILLRVRLAKGELTICCNVLMLLLLLLMSQTGATATLNFEQTMQHVRALITRFACVASSIVKVQRFYSDILRLSVRPYANYAFFSSGSLIVKMQQCCFRRT